jgi:hypothetical protein
MCLVRVMCMASSASILVGAGQFLIRYYVSLQLEKAGWSIDDVDLFEYNEAFAVQSLCVTRETGADPSKVWMCFIAC